MMELKTILIFIGGYLPGEKYGGPVTSIENFSNLFADEYKIRIICCNHDNKEKDKYKNISSGWNKVGNAQVLYIDEKDYGFKYFEDILVSLGEEISFAYLSGIYYIRMNYPAIKVCRKYNIPILLMPCGDLLKNAIFKGNTVKIVKKLVFLRLCTLFKIFDGVYFQSTSYEETDGIKKYLKIDDINIFELSNIPRFLKKQKNSIKEKDKIKILSIGRIVPNKNQLFAIKLMNLVANNKSIVFDIYGPIEDEDYWRQCDDLIKKINIEKQNVKISYKGRLSPSEAKNIYGEYDCLLFPTLNENYGYVIPEALMFDCPVIISKGTTPFDDCDLNAGFSIPLNDEFGFVKAIETICEMDDKEYQKLIQKLNEYIENKFKFNDLKKAYQNVIQTININKD